MGIVHKFFSIGGNGIVRVHISGPNFHSAARDLLNESSLNCLSLSPVKISLIAMHYFKSLIFIYTRTIENSGHGLTHVDK